MKRQLNANAFTAAAFRSVFLGSPIPFAVSFSLCSLLIALALYWIGVPQIWACSIAILVLISTVSAILYERNEKHYQQLESTFRLISGLNLQGPLPPLRGWRLGPDAAVHLVQCLRLKKAEQVVEIGCGVSTVLIAAALQQNDKGKVIALEHNASEVEKCIKQLELLGLKDRASVIHAPLVTHEIQGNSWLWYDISKLPEQLEIDLILIDGPPVWIQSKARYPAIPLLEPKCGPGCIALLDDANRRSERAALQKWKNESPSWQWNFEPTEDGLAVGHYKGSQQE